MLDELCTSLEYPFDCLRASGITDFSCTPVALSRLPQSADEVLTDIIDLQFDLQFDLDTGCFLIGHPHFQYEKKVNYSQPAAFFDGGS